MRTTALLSLLSVCRSESPQKRTVSTNLDYDHLSFAVPQDPHLRFVSSTCLVGAYSGGGIEAFLQCAKASFVSVQGIYSGLYFTSWWRNYHGI